MSIQDYEEYNKYLAGTTRNLVDNNEPSHGTMFNPLESLKEEIERLYVKSNQRAAAMEEEIKRLNGLVNAPQSLRTKTANNEAAYANDGIKILRGAVEFLENYPAVVVAGGIAVAVAVLT
jgi:transcription initiation factor TFIID subunit TAF12